MFTRVWISIIRFSAILDWEKKYLIMTLFRFSWLQTWNKLWKVMKVQRRNYIIWCLWLTHFVGPQEKLFQNQHFLFFWLFFFVFINFQLCPTLIHSNYSYKFYSCHWILLYNLGSNQSLVTFSQLPPFTYTTTDVNTRHMKVYYAGCTIDI